MLSVLQTPAVGLVKVLDPRERWILFELDLAGIQQCLGVLMKTKCETDWAPVFGGRQGLGNQGGQWDYVGWGFGVGVKMGMQMETCRGRADRWGRGGGGQLVGWRGLKDEAPHFRIHSIIACMVCLGAVWV